MATPAELQFWLTGKSPTQTDTNTNVNVPGYASPLPTYNTTPSPTSGQGPYGLVPGTTALPPSTFQQVNTAFPGLTGAPSTITGNILSELQGELSPQAISNMQNLAASYGVSSGMPGANAIPGSLINNKNLLGNILTTQQLQRQGLQDYLGLIGGVGAQQTPQSLATQLSQANAQLKAAPDPAQAAQQQLDNYYAALRAARGPAGGTGNIPSPTAGTGELAPTPALGFGFGTQFPRGVGTPSGSQVTPTSSGTGYGGVPGQPGLAFNPETGEYQDAVPSGMAFNPETGEYQDISQNNFGLGPPLDLPSNVVDTSQQFNPVDPATLDFLYGTG